jgi:hypothetical protein
LPAAIGKMTNPESNEVDTNPACVNHAGEGEGIQNSLIIL